ncbi:hypothetical protein LIER_19324 [Lithospermum erythrorhizon]|uniref:Uncharacterized protein n=1 Tax=Lithospermum erythrorhizon TaxID=34254 RepID=A0AAV3QJZ7_LITER
MGWSEAEVVCMKHKNHMQSPGVCSCCLREKLSKLSVPINLVLPSYNQYSSNSNSSSPTKFYYYSSGHSSPTHMSPPSRSRKHHRIMSDVLSSFSIVSGRSGSDGLKKSRSIAFAAARGGGRLKDGVNNIENIKEKKQGFWSKLIKSTSKRTKEAFVHHPRMKEKLVY